MEKRYIIAANLYDCYSKDNIRKGRRLWFLINKKDFLERNWFLEKEINPFSFGKLRFEHLENENYTYSLEEGKRKLKLANKVYPKTELFLLKVTKAKEILKKGSK